LIDSTDYPGYVRGDEDSVWEYLGQVASKAKFKPCPFAGAVVTGSYKFIAGKVRSIDLITFWFYPPDAMGITGRHTIHPRPVVTRSLCTRIGQSNCHVLLSEEFIGLVGFSVDGCPARL
jgi:hypothetical protein